MLSMCVETFLYVRITIQKSAKPPNDLGIWNGENSFLKDQMQCILSLLVSIPSSKDRETSCNQAHKEYLQKEFGQLL